MNNFIQRVKTLKEGKILEINKKELKEILSEIIHCPDGGHKVMIDSPGEKKGKQKTVKFWGYSSDIETLQVTSINVRLYDSDRIVEIPASQVWGVDRHGSLYVNANI